MDLEQCRYIVVEGPDRRRQDEPRARSSRTRLDARRAARAAGGQSVPGALLRRHAALRAADAAHVPVPARRPAARRSRQLDMFRRPTVADFLLDKDPLFARLNLSDDEYALYEKVYSAPEAADADARPRHLPAGAGRHADRARAPARRRLRARDSRASTSRASPTRTAASSTSTTRRRCSSSTASGSTSSTTRRTSSCCSARIAGMRGRARVLQSRQA